MNIAGVQPQIWISIVAILGIAGLALLVDYLKGKNQQLREAMVELRLRREQDTRQSTYGRMNAATHMGEKQPRPVAAPKTAVKTESAAKDGEPRDFVVAAAQAAAARMAAENSAAAEAPVSAERSEPVKNAEESIRKLETEDRNSEARDRNLAIRQGQDRGVEFASAHGRHRASNPPPDTLPRLEDMNPREALAEWLNKRAAARPTQKPTTATPVAVAAAPETGVRSETPAPAPQADATPAPVAEPVQESAAPDTTGSSVVIDDSLLESLLGVSAASKPARIFNWTDVAAAPVAPITTATEIRFAVIQGAAGIPAGMHDQATLNRLLEANKPFTGLVVSISVNQTDGGAVSRDMMLSVNQFVRGLLREEDFACQSSDDEFLLLCPEEQGAEAQRRLSDISERLWDFQLRGVGSFSVLFGWGDVQVDGETLSEAIASATERMHQTRRARKTVSLDSASPRRKVAAAV